MYRDVLVVDYGPDFFGQAFKVEDGIVCAIPEDAERRPEVGVMMRQLVTEVGGDCRECGRCPFANLS